MKTRVPLLIASDSEDDIAVINVHLKSIFFKHNAATDPSVGAEFIMGLESCVILLCFRTLSVAQDFYTELLREAIKNRPVRHRVVLLCSSAEMGDACGATTRGRFEDFVVFKPLTDPCLLKLRVYRQARALETEARYKGSLAEHQAKKSRQVVDRGFERLDAEHRRMKSQALEHHVEFRSWLMRHLSNLEHQLHEGEMADSLLVLDQEKLSNYFDISINKEIDERLELLRHSVTSSMEGLFEQYSRAREHTKKELNRMIPKESQLTILVVDDDPIFNDLMRAMLEEEGHRVIQAFDGESAYFEAFQKIPNLVIMDINLPKISGIELSRKLRGNTETWGIPQMIVTGSATREVVESGRQLGVREFLVKPFSYETLHEKIHAVMERAKNASS